MERLKTLERAFEEVEEALAGSDGKNVAVWPATVAGLVEELQVLSETQWERLLRVGIRLALEVEVEEIYCFQNVESCGGLIARVLRVVRGSQSGGTRLWKMQQTPAAIRMPKEKRNQSEGSSTTSATRQSPRQGINVAMSKTISPEVQRKRRRVDEAPGVDASKRSVDEVRPPMKTRRLNVNGGKKRVVSVRKSKRGNAGRESESIGDSEQHVSRGRRRRKNEVPRVSPVLVAVDRGTNSSELSSANESEEDGSASDTSDDTHEVSARRAASLAHQAKHKTVGQCDALFATLQQVIAAGLGVDSGDEDEGDTECDTSKSALSARIRVERASAPALFKPFKTIIESASTKIHNGLSAVLAAITAQDSTDYDLLWTEEEDQQHWTMFGEPRTPGRIGVKTRQQHRKAKHSSSKWKCW